MKEKKGFPNIEKFKKQIAIEIQKGILKPIKGEQLFINIMALNIFPFVASPLIKAFVNIDDKAFKQLVEDRKTEVADFIINSIKA
jgi:hypothetical protein